MKISATVLADAATVREGLLHILGGGITRVARDPLPARLDVVLALMLHADDMDDLGDSHNLDVGISEVTAGGTGTPVAKAILELVGTRGQVIPGPNLQVPVVVPIQPVPIPRTGIYEIVITLDDDEPVYYQFEVVKGGEPVAQGISEPSPR